VKGKILGRRQPAAIAGIVTPDTILCWYRTLVAKKYDGSQIAAAGSPDHQAGIAALVVRMANQNPTWRYTHIRGGLHLCSARTKSSPKVSLFLPDAWGPRRRRLPNASGREHIAQCRQDNVELVPWKRNR
jgi:hypothetical protein